MKTQSFLYTIVASAAFTATSSAIINSKNLGAVAFFGDSITQSNADADANGSPRKSLYDKLIAANYSFTYTGSSTTNTDGFNPTTQSDFTSHNGYSGSMISNSFGGRVDMTGDLASQWSTGRLATVKPNVIFATLGTNDVDNIATTGRTTTQIASSYLSYLTQIFTLSDNAGTTPTMIVNTIAPNYRDATRQANTDAFNSLLANVVNGLKAQGRDIYLVDLNTPLRAGHDGTYTANGPGDMADILHPNKIGNGIMADQWMNQINALAVPEPSVLTFSGAAALLMLTRRRRA